MNYYHYNTSTAQNIVLVSFIIVILNLILNSLFGQYYQLKVILKKKKLFDIISREILIMVIVTILTLFIARSLIAVIIIWGGFSIIRGLNIFYFAVSKREILKEDNKINFKKMWIFGVIIILIAVYLMKTSWSLIEYVHYFPISVKEMQDEHENYFIDGIIILTAQAKILKSENIKLEDYYLEIIDLKTKTYLETKYKGLKAKKQFIDRYFSDYCPIELNFNGFGFEAYLLPYGPTPLFPVNKLIQKPSYYADETAKVRKITIHSNKKKCPADAEITTNGYSTEDIFNISEEEVNDMIRFLEAGEK